MTGISRWDDSPGYRHSFEYSRACEYGFSEGYYKENAARYRFAVPKRTDGQLLLPFEEVVK